VRRAIVLLSGGLDSATCLAIAREDGFEAHALTVDYGQRHRAELEAAARVAKALHAASHRVVSVDLASLGGSALTDAAIPVPKDRPDAAIGEGIPPTYVPARNTVLLAVATAAAEALEADAVYVGVNALDYSGYPDCRPAFLEAFRALAAVGTRRGVEGRPIEFRAPLLSETKAGIVRRATALKVPVGETLSCYDPLPPRRDSEPQAPSVVEGAPPRPCGRCDACRLRAKGFAEAGVVDPAARG
jgi:7-cyano-7-deazaguanine synthase